MSYSNYNFNSAENSAQGRGSRGQNHSVDVTNSNLEPTAQEFYPSTSNGAVRKTPQANSRRNNQRHGSGRIFSARSDHPNRIYDRNNDERQKALEDAKKFLQSTNQTPDNKPNEEVPEQSKNHQRNDGYSRRNNYSRNDNKFYNRSYDNNYYDNKGGYNKYGRNYYDNKGDNNRDDRYNPRGSNKTYDRRYENRYQGKNNFRQSKNGHYNDRQSREHMETKLNKKLDAASQRERLEQMIDRKMLECLVCCELIKNSDKTWSCVQCYHILHLSCVNEWAKSSKVENHWRCPACQNKYEALPKSYRCYCGKSADPRPEPGIVPHGCGDVCLRKGRTCQHSCTILCHPGPCPDCNVMVAKPCGCGKTEPLVKCSTDVEIICEAECAKPLECGLHRCASKCHSGPCAACGQHIRQECHCGKLGRKVACTALQGGATAFACDDVCLKLLPCGNHRCQRKCHEGACDACASDLSVASCPCGRTALEPRSSCLDPIPCCDKVCGKKLHCGQPSAPHHCKSLCHEGECPPCELTTMVRCRCGHMDKEMACRKLTTKADDARCEKKCTKKRQCGKHRCNQRCCIEYEHVCPLPCNHQLSCGQHRCERTCHSGRCLPCLETSFDELHCECGASVIYPPVPCGTKPPFCEKACSRRSACGHPMTHQCHVGPCPPCAVLVKRWCHGKHEQRATIPCHQNDFSCGLPCGKALPCKRHKCTVPCHPGACPLPCKRPCTAPRPSCGHACGKPCHEPPCPESVCRQLVPVTCQCGLQKTQRSCLDLADEYRNLEIAKIRDKMSDLAKDQPVDISDIVSNVRRPSILKILECNEECRVLERNRRLAIGLQIRNPDLSQKLTPRYSDFMKQWAKKDPLFCQRVHDKLSDLVQLAKQSKQKSRAHSFECMNRDKRHLIHEYCEHFGVESCAYDTEPNRNIVATAVRDKSWLPSVSLLEFVQRENGHRRVPGPMLNKSLLGKSESVSLRLPGRAQRAPSPPPAGGIDYFDNPNAL
ncbi:unnamed protein product [Brassicogethes aeneus]|uniref:Protein shuttle craft n=1 Tax=Brassicogethes aeneus TaxID=1431903 RepID=A0A9P0BAX8_BRAAE|nr:unnamed protein product [Brassicogethes aeneus]